MKYCNPDTCSECLYIGEGDSICEISHELVLDNWQSVPHTIPQECPFYIRSPINTGKWCAEDE